MKKARFLLGIGVWVAILPHLGISLLIKNILFLVTGLLIVYTASIIYKQIKKEGIGIGGRVFETFKENNNGGNESTI
jgi:hypothetical protein